MTKVIVIGAAGQLGQCLAEVVEEQQVEGFRFLGREEADILDQASLERVFAEHSPAYCINCAAYTAVDKAEEEQALCRQVNHAGVLQLSRLCVQYGTTLLHVSTDFVFAGTSVQPLAETDPTDPVNFYGQSKLEGEQAVQDTLEHYFIIRTSWLYSAYGGNFVKTMLRFGKEREELRVIWDQVGTPTYAPDLARVLVQLIQSGSQAYGLYHYSNEGLTSWYDFAKAIFELSGIQVRVVPVRTFEYVTKARRPAFSVMEKTKIKQTLHLTIPHWRESLKTCLQHL